MIRGDVYRVVLDPIEGSEQGGTRPAIIVSRDAINASSPVVVIVPLTSRSNKQRIYPSHVELPRGEGGLTADSVALCEQVRAISRIRVKDQVGHLSPRGISQVNASLKIALDLP